MQQRSEPVCLPSVPVTSPFVQAPTAPHGDSSQAAAQHGDPELQAELLASLKEMRAAVEALVVVVDSALAVRDADAVLIGWLDELDRVGVPDGFGARADALILRVEGRL